MIVRTWGRELLSRASFVLSAAVLLVAAVWQIRTEWFLARLYPREAMTMNIVAFYDMLGAVASLFLSIETIRRGDRRRGWFGVAASALVLIGFTFLPSAIAIASR
ncbi:MAG TPA: hypothetical protein VHE55_00695 [Fimbriimonadaceae bacterium]|nr:hypothetical protein [Fimbriimonadaceae bacterium]